MLRPPISFRGALCVAAILFVLPVGRAAAQGEEAGASRGGYAWGEGAADDVARSRAPEDHQRFTNIMVTAGVGGAVRIVAFADICDPDTSPGCRFSPAYLQLRGAVFFEGEGPVQHGVGLGVAANLMPDGTRSAGLDPLAQWVFAPSYFFRWYVLEEWVQVMAHVGVPLALGVDVNDTYFNWGLEVAAGAVFKPLTGLGIYAEIGIATFFGQDANAWPNLTFEGGFVFDYEVLP